MGNARITSMKKGKKSASHLTNAHCCIKKFTTIGFWRHVREGGLNLECSNAECCNNQAVNMHNRVDVYIIPFLAQEVIKRNRLQNDDRRLGVDTRGRHIAHHRATVLPI